MGQLTLPLDCNPRHTFANFCADGNAEVLAVLGHLSRQWETLWLHGPQDSGKTHLLQAVCHQAKTCDQSVAYFPFRQMQELGPKVLDGLEHCTWVCLDDVDTVLRQENWERQLFSLINQVTDHGAHLLMSARVPALNAKIELADLRSRLCGAVPLSLRPLDDDRQSEALCRRAKSQGYDLSEDTVRYMQRHVVRGLGQLCRLLDWLEQASLSKQRRITVPFVREVLVQSPTSSGCPLTFDRKLPEASG